MRPVNKPPLSSTLETPRSDIALKKKLAGIFRSRITWISFCKPTSQVPFLRSEWPLQTARLLAEWTLPARKWAGLCAGSSG